MAFDHILHHVYHFRVSSTHVEDRTASVRNLGDQVFFRTRSWVLGPVLGVVALADMFHGSIILSYMSVLTPKPLTAFG